MTSFLVFVVFVIVLFWIASVSNRLASLEKKFKQSALPVSPQPAKSALFQDHEQNSQSVPAVAAAFPVPPVEKIVKTPEEEAATAVGWLTKIGVLALIFGIGFFIKYAIDQGWISEWTRVILGFACGLLLCGLGHLWKEKYRQYAAALTGGGLAIMYFSVFAAYQFYHLLPQPVALVFLVITSGFGLYFAYLQKSLTLGMLAIGGAYLSPLFLHTGADQHVELFIYLAVLNVVAVIVSYEYYRSELLFLSFLGTVFDFAVWGMFFLSATNVWPATLFASFTFLLLLLAGAGALRKASAAKTLIADDNKHFGILTVLLGIFYSWCLFIFLYAHYHNYLALMGLLGSVGAFLAYALVDRLEMKAVNYALAFVGTGLLSLACIWQFSGTTTDFMLIVFGMAVVLAGIFLKRPELRVWGLLTLVACVFAVLAAPYEMNSYVFILNSKFGLVLSETFALWATGWLYKRVEKTDMETQASELAHVIGSLLLWFGFSWELTVYFRGAGLVNTQNLMMSLWWIGYATVLIIFGAMAKSGIYKKIALAIYVLAIVKVFLYDALNLETGYRVVSFIVLGVILLSVSFSYQKNKEKITEFLDK